MRHIGAGRITPNVAAMASPYFQKVLSIATANLIGYWRMDETSGTTATDLSSQGNNGLYINATLANAAGPDGVLCPFFDGADDVLKLYSAAFNSDFNGQEGTVAVWFKVNSASVWTDGAQRQLFEFYVDGSNFLEFLKRTTVYQMRRAVIRSYSSATQLAEIELVEGPRALQPGVPFATTFDTRYREAGKQVLVENYPDQGPVIIAPWHISRQGNLHDWSYDNTARTFTAQSWAAYTGLIWTSTIVLVEDSYLWLFATLNYTTDQVRDNAGRWRWYANAAQVNPIAYFSCADANQQLTTTLVARTGLLTAGTYSAQVEGYCANAGDTITAQYSGAGYIAIPGE